MKLNAKIIEALARAGVSATKIAATQRELLPAPKKLKADLVRRIEAMIHAEGVAVVTSKCVFSNAGYASRMKQGHHMTAVKKNGKGHEVIANV